MDFFEFDFRLHTDRSKISGPHWFELAPGKVPEEKYLHPESRFISEFTFCLIEGPFEKHARAFTHWGYAEVSGSQWELILGDLAALRAALIEAGETSRVALPYAEFPSVQSSFEQDLAANRRKLASFLFSLDQWLVETLARYGSVSVLGL
jgi:hypothetical protein